MSAIPLLTMRETRNLYEILLRQTIEVSPDYEILKPDEKFGCCVAFFNDAMGAICAAYVMGLDLYVYVGTVLQLIPIAGVQGYINSGCLDDNYIEDVYEVLDVFSSLFNREGIPYVSISLMYTPGEELPANEYKMAASYMERRDSILDIEGYDKGRFGAICFN